MVMVPVPMLIRTFTTPSISITFLLLLVLVLSERAAKFKGSKADIRQGVSLLGFGIASSGNLLTFHTGVSLTHVCCSATWACASRLDFHSIAVPVKYWNRRSLEMAGLSLNGSTS